MTRRKKRLRHPGQDVTSRSAGVTRNTSWVCYARCATSAAGLYVAPDGAIWGAEHSGTGRVGRFAAHPGDCDVEIAIDWSRRDEDELAVDDLEQVERHMRGLAFPLSREAA